MKKEFLCILLSLALITICGCNSATTNTTLSSVEISTTKTTAITETATKTTTKTTAITETATKTTMTKAASKPTTTLTTKTAVNFTDVNKTYYALSNGTVRYEPYDDAGSECRMTVGEEVFVMAKGDNGWWKVKYNGNVRYVWYQNLTENKPTTAAPTKKQSSGNSGNSGSNNSSSGSAKHGDTKVVDGQKYVYYEDFGWVRDSGSGLENEEVPDTNWGQDNYLH